MKNKPAQTASSDMYSSPDRHSTPDRHFEMIISTIERLASLAHAKIHPGARGEQTETKQNLPSPIPEECRLQWTYSKIGLVELIYSLKELGAFNNGKADLKSITQCFEYMFSIDLGNVSSSFQEILERKKGYTNITDKLREMFLKKIDSSLNS